VSERLVAESPTGAWTIGPVAVQDARVHVDASGGPVRVIDAFPRK
jgi:hypothetical protein